MKRFAAFLFLVSMSIGALAVYQAIVPPVDAPSDAAANESSGGSSGLLASIQTTIQGWLRGGATYDGLDAQTVSLQGTKFSNPLLPRSRSEIDSFRTFPLNFDSVTIEGKPLAKDEYLGRVLIVDIWATWCPPCRAEIPSFVELQTKYETAGLSVVGMNYERAGSNRDAINVINEFRREQPINYPLILGEDSLTAQVPGFRGFPTTLFVDAKGNVRMMLVGAHPLEVLESYALALLAEVDLPSPTPSGATPPRELPKSLAPGIGSGSTKQSNPFANPQAI